MVQYNNCALQSVIDENAMLPLTVSDSWRMPSKVVALCSSANFINAADRVIMPVAIVGLAKEFGYSLHQQGLILSAFSAGYMSSQVSCTTDGPLHQMQLCTVRTVDCEKF